MHWATNNYFSRNPNQHKITILFLRFAKFFTRVHLLCRVQGKFYFLPTLFYGNEKEEEGNQEAQDDKEARYKEAPPLVVRLSPLNERGQSTVLRTDAVLFLSSLRSDRQDTRLRIILLKFSV